MFCEPTAQLLFLIVEYTLIILAFKSLSLLFHKFIDAFTPLFCIFLSESENLFLFGH